MRVLVNMRRLWNRNTSEEIVILREEYLFINVNDTKICLPSLTLS